MADQVVPVSRLLDERGLCSYHYNLIFWCVLLSLIDGYDIAAIGARIDVWGQLADAVA